MAKARGRPNKKAEAVKKLLEKNPKMPTKDIAKAVGCHPYYVGRVKRDMGLTVSRKKSVSTPVATLGLVRKPKKKALPKTTQQQDYSRGGLLDRAKEIVTNDRQNTHGQPEDSFRRIADLWSGYLTVGIHEQDVAVMMALVKVARIMENPHHADNWIDGAGYFACGGEVALRNK
ncbi:MAG: DUF6378 domain-containing protein [Opitutae bacterium]